MYFWHANCAELYCGGRFGIILYTRYKKDQLHQEPSLHRQWQCSETLQSQRISRSQQLPGIQFQALTKTQPEQAFPRTYLHPCHSHTLCVTIVQPDPGSGPLWKRTNPQTPPIICQSTMSHATTQRLPDLLMTSETRHSLLQKQPMDVQKTTHFPFVWQAKTSDWPQVTRRTGRSTKPTCWLIDWGATPVFGQSHHSWLGSWFSHLSIRFNAVR